MPAQIGLHTASSGEQGLDHHAIPDINAAGSLGAQQALVAGETENVDIHVPDINGEYTGGLGGIYHIQQIVSSCDGSDSADVQQVSGEIGTVCCEDGSGIGPDSGFKILITDGSVGVSRKDRQLKATIFQFVKGSENGVVFQGGGDHMISGLQCAFDGDIQRLGRVGGKGDPLRTFRAEQFCQRCPGIINQSGRTQRAIVDATTGISQTAQGVCHGIDHTVRLS